MQVAAVLRLLRGDDDAWLAHGGTRHGTALHPRVDKGTQSGPPQHHSGRDPGRRRRTRQVRRLQRRTRSRSRRLAPQGRPA
eukprot:350105-Chlamydomonas_euryale.AAC.2